VPCPADCTYLTGAHAPGWDGRESERVRDLRRVSVQVSNLSPTQERVFALLLHGLAAMRTTRRGLDDALVTAAVTALRRTAETRANGVLYQHVPEDPRAAGVAQDLAELLVDRDDSGQPVTPSDADLVPALSALESGLLATGLEGAGPTAFLETAGRLSARLAVRERPQTGPRLIVEP
jgi:hypothetical protein